MQKVRLVGLDLQCETDLRILGCELIQAAGILLRLPQVGPRRAGPRRGGAIVAGGGGA